MGYLDNSSVTIDAILTTKGRELLAQGGLDFVPTKFALGDDEIDYTLWNSNNPSGTSYYGIIIENMPILEATPDETQALRSKLITLPKLTQSLPILGGTGIDNVSAFTIDKAATILTLTPKTTITGTTAFTETYTVTISDSTVLTLAVTAGTVKTVVGLADTIIGTKSDAHSVTGIGTGFTVSANGSNLTTIRKATVTILGNLSGVTKTIPITVSAF